MRRESGFTLIELIIAMVITGIIAGMVAVFIAQPVEGYIASVRRAGLTDIADGINKRMALELRSAVPNSVRIDSTGRFMEFIPSKGGGRYCTDTDSGCDPLTFDTGGKTFDVLGQPHTGVAGDFMVVCNWGVAELNAYAGDNIRVIDNHPDTTTTSIRFAGDRFPFASPSNRFQIVGPSGPVTFACENVGGGANGTGTLKRYSGYATSLPFGVNQPITGLGTGALMADNISNCSFSYNPTTPSDGLVVLNFTVRRENEAVSLVSQIHVDNLP